MLVGVTRRISPGVVRSLAARRKSSTNRHGKKITTKIIPNPPKTKPNSGRDQPAQPLPCTACATWAGTCRGGGLASNCAMSSAVTFTRLS